MDPIEGKKLFEVFDDDYDGFLNFDQVLEIFAKLGLPLNKVEQLNIDGLFDFNTFISLFEPLIVKEPDISEALLEYDPELNGTIHIGVLINILRFKLDSDDINEILRDIKYDDNLIVNYAKILHNQFF